MDSKNYLSVRQAAERLGLCQQTIRNLVKAGKIAAIKVGRKYQVDPDGLKMPEVKS
jgi:excisionase family DNA binding protein